MIAGFRSFGTLSSKISLLGFIASSVIVLLTITVALAPFISPIYLIVTFILAAFTYVKLGYFKKWLRLVIVIAAAAAAVWLISGFLYIIGGVDFAPHSDVLIIYIDIHKWVVLVAALIAVLFCYLYESRRFWLLVFFQSFLLFIAFYLREDMFSFLHPWQNTLVLSMFFAFQIVMLNKNGSRFFYAALLFLLLSFTFSGVFAIVPAIAKGDTRKGGGLLEASALNYRFSSTVDLEPEIELPDSLLLLYKREGQSSGELLKHKSMSLYTPGGGFSVHPLDLKSVLPDPEEKTYSFRNREYEDNEGVTIYSYRERLSQEMYFLQLDREILYRPEILSLSQLELKDSRSFSWAYQLESQVSNALPFHLRIVLDPDEGLTDNEREVYTRYNGSDVIADMASEIVDGIYIDKARDRYDAANAINNYLLDNYYYSLKPGPAPQGERLEYFLTSGKKGYCSYFAMSMVLMLRSLDIPARLVTGFYVDPDSRVLDYYPIRANLAHAWVEVYFGKAGWIEFDPTSQVLAPGEFMRFDSMYQEDDAIKKLIEEILKGKRILSNNQAVSSGSADWGIVLLIIFFTALYVMYQLVFRWFLYLPFWSKRQRYQYMVRYLTLKAHCFAKGFNRGETLSQWAGRIQLAEVSDFIKIYDQYRFDSKNEHLTGDGKHFLCSWKAAMKSLSSDRGEQIWWILLPGIRRPF